jgi:hypothetical protein
MMISGPSVKSGRRPLLPKCNARRGNDGARQMAIAGAGEIMELNVGVETGAWARVLNQVSTGAPYFRGRGTP